MANDLWTRNNALMALVQRKSSRFNAVPTLSGLLRLGYEAYSVSLRTSADNS